LSDQLETLQKLLDGELGAEILEKDPVLAKLAERIYGEDFLETMGLSRGESKRALSESLSDDLDDDLLVEIIPTDEIDDLEPFEAPQNLPPPITPVSDKKIPYFRLSLLILPILNLFGLFSFLGAFCEGNGCPSTGNTKINLASIGNLDSGWGWSPSLLEGAVGIPDILMILFSLSLIGLWYFRK